MIAAASSLLALLVATNGNRPISRDAKICAMSVPPVSSAAFLDKVPMFDERIVFEKLVTLFSSRKYERAAALFHERYDSVYGRDWVQNAPSTSFFLAGRFRLGLIALYQVNFCHEWTQMDPRFFDANAVEPFESALVEAINGEEDAAQADAAVAKSRDSDFAYTDIVRGVLCEARGDRACAHDRWLSAAANHGPAFPETEIDPERFVAVRLLLHFRP